MLVDFKTARIKAQDFILDDIDLTELFYKLDFLTKAEWEDGRDFEDWEMEDEDLIRETLYRIVAENWRETRERFFP